MRNSNRLLHTVWVLFVVLSCILSSLWAQERVDYPERDLRGYGRLSAALDRSPDRTVLSIQCENAARAKVVHAKYVSDLQLFGGVQQIKIDGLPVFEVDGQGSIAAWQYDRTVVIVSAREKNKLFLKTMELSKDTKFLPEVEVPMLLDSWDKFAFRYYYRPWEVPKGTKWADYDPITTEFDHAKQFDRCGFIFWSPLHDADTARGMTNQTWWNWGFRAVSRRQLPVVINTSANFAPWITNRYRDQTQQRMPDYLGSYHSVGEPFHGGTGTISWCATTAKDWELNALAKIIQTYSKEESVIDFLEPHGELKHGDYDIFVEYGPIADENYRSFLKNRYETLEKLSVRWYGRSDTLRSWDEVRVPELSSFIGESDALIDLKGNWKVAYEPDRPKDAPRPNAGNIAGSLAPEEWFSATFNDSAWAQLRTPGHDLGLFTRRSPAVFRQTIEIPGEWLKKHPKVWLYVWDINNEWWHSVQAWVNGTKIGDEPVRHPRHHWFAPEASAVLKPGKNVIALRLPQAFLGYKVYLSPEPPRQYPFLGKEKNAQWVDFADWRRHTRIEMCRRGLEMIRQHDKDRGIVLMAPDSYTSDMKVLAEDYGGRFHNTGYMAATWAEPLPMLMRGADLPFSLEPGGPADNVHDFKRMLGYYMTEGVNAIHYFINAGCILWDEDMRKHLEEYRAHLSAMGRMHVPKADAAFLLSDRVQNLVEFPWGFDLNANLASGYWTWRVNETLLPFYPMDAVGNHDFARGTAKPYKLILDTNTSIMDAKQIQEIENWVRDGGIFVAYVQSGRHTPEEPNSWAISQLTGYEVLQIDPLKENGDPVATRAIRFVPGQEVFKESEWGPNDLKAHGLSLKRTARACRDLILWEDGTVAAGVRTLGKGKVVHLGLRHLGQNAWQGHRDGNTKMLMQLFAWAGLRSQPAKVEGGTMLRHNVSNNGLYDVWVMWNDRDQERKDVTLRIHKPVERLFDLKTGQPVSTESKEGNTVRKLDFTPQETVAYYSPRGEILDAPARWFELQRNWWRGGRTSAAAVNQPEPPKERWTVDLSNDWKTRFVSDVGADGKPIDFGKADTVALAKEDVSWTGAGFDDSAWTTGKVDVWITPEEQQSRRLQMRRTLTVPNEWKDAEIDLYVKSFFANIAIGRLAVWLDGQLILNPEGGSRDGIYRRITADVQPGKSYVLALEMFGEGTVTGLRGNAWLSAIPKPKHAIDLAGTWAPSKDALNWDEPITLPGPWKEMITARRTVKIGEELRGTTVCFRLLSSGHTNGVIVNGQYVRRHHHNIGTSTHLNITPCVNFGAENEIMIVGGSGPSNGTVEQISLDFYPPEPMYP